MRLGDLTRRGRDETDVPAEVERELEALDAALRGDEVPAELGEIEALVSDLRAERREPEDGFAAELDAWAAQGFPRAERPGTRAASGRRASSSEGLLARLVPSSPRGVGALAAGAAAVIVVGVGISQVATLGGGNGPGGGVTGEIATQDGGEAVQQSVPEAAGDTAVESASPSLAEPGSSEREFSERPGNSRAQEKRRVEREAQLTLAAPADEVADLNDEVIGVVEGANGIVLDSRVTSNDDSARATLEVEVPSASLDETMAALSELANVQSRSDQARDITGSFVSARDRLVGLRAERDSLAARIRDAKSNAEVRELQGQLDEVNRRLAAAREDLSRVSKQAQFATITIVITSEGAGAGGDGWSFGDALRAAGKVLEVAAGVALISAAVLTPLALIAAIAFFVISAANRRARERALGD